jgi:hypothetical protein
VSTKLKPGPSKAPKRPSKDDRKEALNVVEAAIRKSGIEPGFDYAATVRALMGPPRRYSHQQIAKACGVGKNTVGGWVKGSVPRHKAGERLFILHYETFEKKKPPFKKYGE